MKFKHLFAGVAAIGLIAGTAWLFREPVSLAVASRMMEKRMGGDALAELPDGLHVGLCGAGSPFPDDLRSGPCTLVVAGQRMMVFDAGSGAARNIGKMGFNHGRIAAVFLTHFHSDHIDGLGELMLQRWVTTSNVAPLPVHGPAGVQQVVGGLMQAYAQDQHYRVAHHGQPTVPASGFGGNPVPFQLGADGRAVLVKDADLEVVAFTVDHAPVHPSVGYRIQYKGRTVVLSGDTRKSPAVQREAANVDLLVHEALSVRLVQLLADGAAAAGRKNLVKIFADIQDYHATPEQAAETARDAKARHLLLNHIVPTLPPLAGLDKVFLGDATAIYGQPVRIGTDGDFVSLPAGSTEVRFGRRFQ